MTDEPRAGKCGRFSAAVYDNSVNIVPKYRRDTYLFLFGDELSTFSFKPVSRAEKISKSDYWELTGYSNPLSLEDDGRMLARILKEDRHLGYQTGTAYNFMRSFLFHFQRGSLRPVLDIMKHLPKRHKNAEEDKYIYDDFP